MLEPDRKLEKSLSLIITCTRRVKRPKDLVTLAKNISFAAKKSGGIEELAKAVNLSVQQLEDFLSVEDLCTEVKGLVGERTIDSVDVVKTISKLPPKKQKILAEYLVRGKFASKDVRIITTFAKRFADRPIEKVIRDYEKSKDVKLYVAQFRVPAHFNNQVGLHKRFEDIVGKNEMRKLQFQGRVVVLEVTSLGYKKLREAVRKEQTTLRRFIESTVSKMGSGK
jgi:hypothetical protein